MAGAFRFSGIGPLFDPPHVRSPGEPPLPDFEELVGSRGKPGQPQPGTGSEVSLSPAKRLPKYTLVLVVVCCRGSILLRHSELSGGVCLPPGGSVLSGRSFRAAAETFFAIQTGFSLAALAAQPTILRYQYHGGREVCVYSLRVSDEVGERLPNNLVGWYPFTMHLETEQAGLMLPPVVDETAASILYAAGITLDELSTAVVGGWMAASRLG